MKRRLIVLMALLMAFSLAGCSSKEGTAEAGSVQQANDGKARVGDTEFLMPDEVMELKSVNIETEENPEEDNCDLKVTVYYEGPEKAMEAYVMYTDAYLGIQFPERMDSNGYLIRVSNPDMNGSDQLVIRIRKGVIVNDEVIQKYAGKYLLTEYEGDQSMTDFVKKSWEDKSFYSYLEIREDGTATLRTIKDGRIEAENAATLQSLLNDSGTTTEENRIRMKTRQYTLLFERNDEIPADPE